jgi:hypothetical protein
MLGGATLRHTCHENQASGGYLNAEACGFPAGLLNTPLDSSIKFSSLFVMYRTNSCSSLALYMTDTHRVGLWTQTTPYQTFSFMNVDIATSCSLECWYQLFGTACWSSPSSLLKIRCRVLGKRWFRGHCGVAVQGDTIRIESNCNACFYTIIPMWGGDIFFLICINLKWKKTRKDTVTVLFNDTGKNTTSAFQIRCMQLCCR